MVRVTYHQGFQGAGGVDVDRGTSGPSQSCVIPPQGCIQYHNEGTLDINTSHNTWTTQDG